MNAPPSSKLISVQTPRAIVGTWLFTIFWCGISFTLFWAFAIRARESFGGAIASLFSLIGLAMLYATAKVTLEYFKYGQVAITLGNAVPETGKALSATIRLPAAAAAAGKVSAELACVEMTWSRGSKGGLQKTDRDAWSRKQEFPVRRGAADGYATLKFEIPADQPYSTLEDETNVGKSVTSGYPAGIEAGRPYYRWEIRVKADVPGIDLERAFQLRVAQGKGAVAVLPAAVPAEPVVLDAATGQRIAARRNAERRLGIACTLVAVLPILLPAVIVLIAVRLADCPFSWGARSAPACAFAGVNWGPVMASTFNAAFVAIPAALIGCTVLYIAGQLWLHRGQRSVVGSIVGPLIGLAIVGSFLYQSGLLDPRRMERWVVESTGFVPATAIGFEVSPGHARHIAVSARGVSVEGDGRSVLIRVKEIRLEKLPGLTPKEYLKVGATVYRAGDWPSRSYGFNWHDVPGTLTREAPVTSLENRIFVFPGVGARCHDGGCEARLFLVVQAAPDRTHREDTEGVRLRDIAAVPAVSPQPRPARYPGSAAGH